MTTCQSTGLSYALGTKTGSSQVTQAVDLTNTGSSACTMTGYPGVDVVGQANGNPDYTWSLIRQSAVNRGPVSYSTVTLQPGATAHFNLFYLPGVVGQGVNIFVVKMVITPPDDFTQAQLTWGQLVVLQDNINYPGTYISPVMPGA